MSNDPKIAYQGEMLLLSWAETNSRGRTVTFQLDDDGEGHPFAASRTKVGKSSGQRYAVVLVAIGDDEKAIEKTPSQMAFLICRDPAFWHFCNERSFAVVDSEESARAHILEACRIQSRSELDKNPGARSLWLTVFQNPFSAQRAAIDAKAYT